MDISITFCSDDQNCTNATTTTKLDSPKDTLPQTQILSDADNFLIGFSEDYQKMANWV